MSKILCLVVISFLLTACAAADRAVDKAVDANRRMEAVVDRAQDSKRKVGYDAWCVRLPVSELWAMATERQAALKYLCNHEDGFEVPKQ